MSTNAISKNIMNVLIDKREDQGSGVAVLELRPLAGQKLPNFSAGAHIDVHIAEGIVRQYSLSNSSDDSDLYRIGVLNDPNSRGGSVKLFESFTTGQEIKIGEPNNHFPLEQHDSAAVLLAGGIGITPILAMAYELRKQQRPFEIHYCLRTRSAGAFIEELSRAFSNEFHLYCDDETPFDANKVLADRADKAHIYTCGPTGFMDWLIATAKEQGFSDKHIHFEYFSAEVDTSGEVFEVYCSSSDKTINVGAEQTIAKALNDAGIKVDVSCEQGVCGTCITDVLEGEPDHRDHFLTDEEKADNDQIAVCCSRAKSTRLVLDI